MVKGYMNQQYQRKVHSGISYILQQKQKLLKMWQYQENTKVKTQDYWVGNKKNECGRSGSLITGSLTAGSLTAPSHRTADLHITNNCADYQC